MLRGINIGAHKRISMKELAALVEGLGYRDVSTYLQSGNVVFSTTGSADAIATALAKQIVGELGHDVAVIVRTANEMNKIVQANPFDPKVSHVTFLAGKPPAAKVKEPVTIDCGRDEFEVVGREIFLSMPHGYGRTKLNNTFWERRFKTVATTRNWNSVLALREQLGR
jgi:uncharacterized protein (DUF1697 family)